MTQTIVERILEETTERLAQKQAIRNLSQVARSPLNTDSESSPASPEVALIDTFLQRLSTEVAPAIRRTISQEVRNALQPLKQELTRISTSQPESSVMVGTGSESAAPKVNDNALHQLANLLDPEKEEEQDDSFKTTSHFAFEFPTEELKDQLDRVMSDVSLESAAPGREQQNPSSEAAEEFFPDSTPTQEIIAGEASEVSNSQEVEVEDGSATDSIEILPELLETGKIKKLDPDSDDNELNAAANDPVDPDKPVADANMDTEEIVGLTEKLQPPDLGLEERPQQQGEVTEKGDEPTEEVVVAEEAVAASEAESEAEAERVAEEELGAVAEAEAESEAESERIALETETEPEAEAESTSEADVEAISETVSEAVAEAEAVAVVVADAQSNVSENASATTLSAQTLNGVPLGDVIESIEKSQQRMTQMLTVIEGKFTKRIEKLLERLENSVTQ